MNYGGDTEPVNTFSRRVGRFPDMRNRALFRNKDIFVFVLSHEAIEALYKCYVIDS